MFLPKTERESDLVYMPHVASHAGSAMPGDILVNATAGAIIIGIGTFLVEWAFARYAGIERDTLSAVICSLIAYISVGVMDGFMSGRDFVAAYFRYLPGLGTVLLLMLWVEALRSWWRRGRSVKRLSR
jgi:hypothetical protein